MANVTLDETKNLAKGTGGNIYDDISKAPMLDPTKGGQNGFRKKIYGTSDNGNRVIELHNDTKYHNTQIIPVLMQAPKGFDLFDDPGSWRESLRHIVENRAESITGLKGALTVNFSETPISGAGEQYSQVANVLRERTEVEFTWRDIVGRPIQKLLLAWIHYLMMDPDTKVPKATMLAKYGGGVNGVDSWTTDYQTMTVLFIEMDVAHRYVDKAWLVTSMMPKTSGPIEGRRNYQEDAAPLDLAIGFTGAADSGQNVIELATSVIATMGYISSDSDFMELGFDSIPYNDVMIEAKAGFQSDTNDEKHANLYHDHI